MQNPNCIDLFLTNNSYTFQQTTTIWSGLFDCHKKFLTGFLKVIQDKLLTETVKNLIL